MNIVRLQIRRWASQAATELVVTPPSLQKLPNLSTTDDSIELPDEYQPRSLLEPLEEDISHYGQVSPTFNFAQYINKSEGLQNLIKLGVNLHKIEKKAYWASLVLKLDFERDVKKRLVFLNDYVSPEELGTFITKNPMILREDIDDLQVRINYLQSKNFDNEMIKRIVTKNPFWLMFPTLKIDARLGHFQKEYGLTGREVRQLACTQPRLITYSKEHVFKNTFSLREEMGFSSDDMKHIILSNPRIFMINHLSLIKSFNYVHLKMNIPHSRIVEVSGVLLCKARRLKERDEFLKKIGRAQYDCTKPLYVSLHDLISGDDAKFCLDVAKCSLLDYNTYLKSL